MNSTFSTVSAITGGAEEGDFDDNGDDGIQINIYYAIAFPLISLVTTVFNLTTIVAFIKVPGLRDKPGEFLILNLCCADLLTGAAFIPTASPQYITPGHWPLGEAGCRVVTSIMNLSIHGSLFALIAISFDRFLMVSVEYPKYVKMQSYRRIYLTIGICWTLAVLTVIIEQALWEWAKTVDETAASIDYKKFCLVPPRRIRWFSLTFFAVLFFLPVVTVFLLSIAFLWQLRKRLKKNVGSGLSKAAKTPGSATQVSYNISIRIIFVFVSLSSDPVLVSRIIICI